MTTRFTAKDPSASLSVDAKRIGLAGALGVIGVLAVFGLARLTGTDFTVAAPPAITTPLPWWLFVAYSMGGGAAMFAVVPVAQKLPRPRALAYAAVLAGLAAMTPAPFFVSTDLATIFWLTASHVALVAPLLALCRTLPRVRQP